jgi:hypothetical protein
MSLDAISKNIERVSNFERDRWDRIVSEVMGLLQRRNVATDHETDAELIRRARELVRKYGDPHAVPKDS